MRRILANNKGFTLIELVTVIVVLGILAVFSFDFMDYATQSYAIASRQMKLSQEAACIMERILKELKDANYVLSVDGMDYLRLNKVNTADQVDKDHDVQYMRYWNTLYRWTSTNRYVVMSSKVKGFEISKPFSTCDASTPQCVVTVRLEMEDWDFPVGEDKNEPITFSLIGSVSPRNFESGRTGRTYNGDFYEVVTQ